MPQISAWLLPFSSPRRSEELFEELFCVNSWSLASPMRRDVTEDLSESQLQLAKRLKAEANFRSSRPRRCGRDWRERTVTSPMRRRRGLTPVHESDARVPGSQ